MRRTFRSLVWSFGLAVYTIVCGVGCSHLIETHAITAFSKNLKDEDLDGLLKVTTDEFHQRALRTATAMEDFKILNLPDGKTTIVEVEEVSEDKKRVTVQIEDASKSKGKKEGKQHKKEIFYELAREKDGRWVVDDIYLKQKHKGVVAIKSVTEQMDLLLTVREFIDTWSRSDREQVLSVTSKSFREALEPLPPSYLAQLTRVVSAGKSTKGKYKPNAQLDDKMAVVRLPRITGETIISLELTDDHWRVSDIAIESKGEDQLPSMLRVATAVNACTSFLTAFAAGDKPALAEWAAPDFYEGSLAIGDLRQVKLPDAQLSEHDMQVKVKGNRADFVFKNDTELVQIDMHKSPESTPNSKPRYQVNEVTIYEVATKQEKRLSALFTAQGMLEIFVRALTNRDLDTLRHASTRDLSNRVWRKLNEATVSAMPLEAFDSNEIELVNTSFQGALTRVDLRQGGRQMSYLLREERGRFYVDDVQWQITGIPSSMKTTLEILVPIQDFASAIAQGREPEEIEQKEALEKLQANSTSDFNRSVWSQTEFVPNSGLSADTFLLAPLRGIALTDQEVTVQLGDNRFGARVTLRREFERFVVDDVQLIAGPEESKRLALKSALRTQMARGESRGPSNVVQASGTSPTNEEPAAITPTGGTRSSRVMRDSAVVPAGGVRSGNHEPEVSEDPFAGEILR